MLTPEDVEFARLLEQFRQAQERGDVQEAEAIGIRCLLAASSAMEEEQDEGLQSTMEARQHEESARWEEAEAAHRRALSVAVRDHQPGMVYKAHHDLSALYHLRGMRSEALEEARLAVDAARQTKMAPVLTVALESLATSHLVVGDVDSAAAAADEMVTATPADKMYDLARARALVVRARCRAALGSLEAADDDLDTAWPILEPQAAAQMLAGVQGSLAAWWETKAQIRAGRGDRRGAADALGEALRFRRTISTLPQLPGPHKYASLARALGSYAQSLLAADDLAGAKQAFEESRAIFRRIGVSADAV